jgi:hypothetical protein
MPRKQTSVQKRAREIQEETGMPYTRALAEAKSEATADAADAAAPTKQDPEEIAHTIKAVAAAAGIPDLGDNPDDVMEKVKGYDLGIPAVVHDIYQGTIPAPDRAARHAAIDEAMALQVASLPEAEQERYAHDAAREKYRQRLADAFMTELGERGVIPPDRMELWEEGTIRHTVMNTITEVMDDVAVWSERASGPPATIPAPASPAAVVHQLGCASAAAPTLDHCPCGGCCPEDPKAVEAELIRDEQQREAEGAPWNSEEADR